MSIPAKLMCSSVFLLFIVVVYAANLPDDWEEKELSLVGTLLARVGLICIPVLIGSILWEIWIQ